jgi:NAD(P)-dependent dehydrogenase (short-subunit alcohol dehydrogenase family)
VAAKLASRWEGRAAFARINPLRRPGEPDDVAGVAALPASRAASYINGQTLVVGGVGLIAGAEPLA